MKRVLIVAPSDLPIPSVKGGAVETGIDQILAMNENEDNDISIDVVSFFDNLAYKESKKYKKVNFLFYKKSKVDDILFFFFKALNKLLKLLSIDASVNTRPLFIRYICKKMQLQSYDAILVKNAVNYILPLSKHTNGNLFLQLHNDFLNRRTPNAFRIAQKCEAIIANSEYIRGRVLSIEGLKKDGVLLNMNCLDEGSFKIADKEKRAEILEKYGIDDDSKIILFSGRLVKEKGVKELLTAIGGINKDKNWKLMIAGSKWFSTNRRDGYVRRLKLLSKEFSENIVFLGYIPHSVINYYNSIADVVVVPSIWEEPAGRVALEAAAVGTPVIVADSGGLKEYVDGSNSVIVKKDKNFVNNIRSSIEEILFENRFSSESSKESLISFARKFNSKRYYEEIMKFMGVLRK